MNKTPLYITPTETPNIPYSQIHHWDAAVESFDENHPLLSLTHLLNYINKNILGKDKITKDTAISFPHGSSIINIKIKNDEFIITAPFLKITESHKVALLRKIAEINFHPLTLARIKLKANLLWFEYRTSVELIQPNKIYDVLREICVFADDFDDAFIKKYNALFYQKPQIEHFKPENEIQIYEDIQTYLSDCLNLVKSFEQERMTGYIWGILISTCFKIVDMSGIQGSLRTELEEQITFLRHNKKINLEDRITQTKAFILQLKDLSFDDLSKNFYRCEFFISTKFRSSLPIIQQYLAPFKARKDDEFQLGNHKAAFFTIYYAFLSLIYDYNISKEHFIIITTSLEKTNQIDWKDGAKILNELFNKFINGTIGNSDSKKQGFFAKLFTNR